MYLRPAWKEKENRGRNRVNSDNGEACAPKACRVRLLSDSGRPVLSDVSNNFRGQNTSNQEEKSGGSSLFTKMSTLVLNPKYTMGEHGIRIAHQENVMEKVISPILSTHFTVTHRHLKNDIKPQKKKTLVARSSRYSKFNENAPYCLDIYTPEYIDDIILNSMKDEAPFKLKKKFYAALNPLLDNRPRVLNYLISIEDDLYINSSMYYSIVYLFDLALSKVFIPSSMYQMVLITIAWLITKYSGTKVYSAPKLARICDYAFSEKSLLDMECKMLRIFQFSFKTPVPTVFLNYYLRKLNVQSDHQIVFTTYYIMDTFTLSSQYSTYEASRVAAGALYLCITSLYPGESIYERLKHAKGYYSPSRLYALTKVMLAHLKESICNDSNKVIFSKYCTRDTKFASVRFSRYMK